MKKAFLFLLALAAFHAKGQVGLTQVESRIDAQKAGRLQVFKQAIANRNRPDFPQVSAYELLESDPRVVALLLDQEPQAFVMALPGPDQRPLELELEQVELLTDDYVLRVSDDEAEREESKGVFYRGRIKGDPNSIAAISVFENGMQAMFSSAAIGGDYHVVPVPNGEETSYMLYADRHLRNVPPFECQTADETRGYTKQELTPQIDLRNGTRCVKVYLEIDFDVFQSKGSVAATEEYIKGLFNEVATLYSRDGITVVLSEMFIWTRSSPYPDLDVFQILRSFQSVRTTMNGDVGQLITYKGSGGIAVVDGLCRTNVASRVGVSSIDNFFRTVPAYSFTVMVVAHEIGHILGSSHTHACVWNGNNTAIDGCAGATEGSCANPGIPSTGGTIMSYCHLTSVGINFLNGFGPQPATLIRNRIANASCITVCSAPPPPPPGDTTSNKGCDSVTLTLTLDHFGTETTWQILNTKGQTLFQGGPYANKQAGRAITASFCLPRGDCYTFKVKDTDADGICCNYGNGAFRLVKKTGTQTQVIASGDRFGQESSTNFCVDTTSTGGGGSGGGSGGGGSGGGNSSSCTLIDFLKTPPATYGGGQDAGRATVQDAGRTILVENNAWKMVPLAYDIKPTTLLAFEFRSTSQGEVHGIGFDSDLFVSAQLTFQLWGTQTWGLQTYRNYEGNGAWKTYVIPVGKFYTGGAKYLFFAMDDDVSPALGNSFFRNVRVYEEGTTCAALPAELILPEMAVLSLYPNPARDQIRVKAMGIQEATATLSVFNALGQEMRRMPLKIGDGSLEMDLLLDNLKSGNYTLRLLSGDQILTQNFVIQR
jgi:uncharacterized membrane protein YgcG